MSLFGGKKKAATGPIAPVLRDSIEHPWWMYRYHQGDSFSPGVQDYVFEPTFSLLPLSLLGAATLAGNGPHTQQTPQVWVNPALPVVGLGGLAAGQYALQGLLAPDGDYAEGDES